MTSASLNGTDIMLRLSREEALVLFEWLSRNWERNQWSDEELFSDPAEKQMLIWLENDLQKLLPEPFEKTYERKVLEGYRKIVPSPKDW